MNTKKSKAANDWWVKYRPAGDSTSAGRISCDANPAFNGRFFLRSSVKSRLLLAFLERELGEEKDNVRQLSGCYMAYKLLRQNLAETLFGAQSTPIFRFNIQDSHRIKTAGCWLQHGLLQYWYSPN